MLKSKIIYLLLLLFTLLVIKTDVFAGCANCGTATCNNGSTTTVRCCISGSYDPCGSSGRTCTENPQCAESSGCSIPEDCPNKSNQEQCGNQACSVGKECNSGSCEYFCVGEAPCNPPGATGAPTTGPTNTPIPPVTAPPGVTIPPPPVRLDPPDPECSAWGGGDVRLRVTNSSPGNQFRFFTYNDNACGGTELDNSGWIASRSHNVAGLGSGGFSWDARARYTAAAGGSAKSVCSAFRVDRVAPNNPAPFSSINCGAQNITFSWNAVSDNRCLGNVHYWVQGNDSTGTDWFINGWVPYPYAVGQTFTDATSGLRVRINSATSITLLNPDPSKAYRVRLRAGDSEGSSAGMTHPNQTAWTSYVANSLNTCPFPPRGTFDAASCASLAGWTCDPNNYNTALTVRIYEGATLITSGTAGSYRADVAAAGVCAGTGNHGFSITTPPSLIDGSPHTLTAKAVDIYTGVEYDIPNGNPKLMSACAVPAWYKLKDASFNKHGDLINPIPLTVTTYDGTDTSQALLVGNSAGSDPGLVVKTGSTTDLDPQPATSVSSKQWVNSSTYSINGLLSPQTFINYVKSRKDYRQISDITAPLSSGIYLVNTSSLTIDQTKNTHLMNSTSPIVLLVEGNVVINMGALGSTFGAANKNIAIVATGRIEINQFVSTMYGVFAANQIVFSNIQTTTPLKIQGNIYSQTSTNTGIRNRGGSNSAPSIFVVFDSTQYINLLPLLSTSTYEWKQLQ